MSSPSAKVESLSSVPSPKALESAGMAKRHGPDSNWTDPEHLGRPKPAPFLKWGRAWPDLLTKRAKSGYFANRKSPLKLSAAMASLPIPLSLTLSSLAKTPSSKPSPSLFKQYLNSRPLQLFQPNTPSHFTALYKLPSPSSPVESSPQLSDDDNDPDFDEEDDEDDLDSEEYEPVSADIQDDSEQEEDDEDDEENAGVGVSGRDSRYEEFKWQRVERFRNEVREFGKDIIDVEELASVYNFRIDKFQRLAIQAFLRGSSVVVSAPTSSGKTLIAESAAVATVARGRRLFYTTPLKALSNQKFRDFRETFGDANVGLLTGDSAVNKDAHILIMTTEILRNMLYQSVGMDSSESALAHVDVIVLDEVHYLSDMSRGTVWEEIVIYCPKQVQLICLSATVANPDELAGWIGQIHGKTELVTSSKRPVPLTWHFSTKTSLLPLLNEKGTGINRNLLRNQWQLDSSGGDPYEDEGSWQRKSRKNKLNTSTRSKNGNNFNRRSQVPQVIDTLWHLKAKDMLPAVWFIFSRKGCDASVQYLEDFNLLNECEITEVELALKRFRLKYPDAIRESSVKGLLRGVAAHHAGCLPLWKSFIEELFQKGLVKVVFATETLAAGINMPARTAVISSLSKRTENGRILLNSNELLQMAGRAGRRGIDERGHVVVIQTANEGAKECYKALFSGLKPLVSQFTASYGMVLNLLAGAKITRSLPERVDSDVSRAGRTLEEARKLVEQSFGNYVGSNVMVAAKDELARVQNEIQMLASEITDEAIDKKSRKQLSKSAYQEIAYLQEELKGEKLIRTELRKRMELERINSLKPLLKELGRGHLAFICLQHTNSDGNLTQIPAVYLGEVDSLNTTKVKKMVNESDSFALNKDMMSEHGTEPSYHVALSSDNSWYLFTEKWVRTIYKTGFPNVALAIGDAVPSELMTVLLDKGEMQWEKVAESELGGLWSMEGSLETWSWSLNVPVLSSLSQDDEVVELSETYRTAIELYKDHRNKVARLKKKIARTEGFKEYKKILDVAKFTGEKIRRLNVRSRRLATRIEQIEPSGWKEFLQISNVIHEIRALDINSHVIFPLGETAAAIRGENELWLAAVLRNKILLDLKPAQLAAVCGSLVSENVRSWKNNSYVYEASTTVMNVITFLEEQRISLLELQEKHGVQIPCCLDSQFAGMVEAWASGLTWREIMMDCAMDEGDLARLLRRTIDLLAQVPKLPDIDPLLKSSAVKASSVMDRPPIKSYRLGADFFFLAGETGKASLCLQSDGLLRLLSWKAGEGSSAAFIIKK
ncbi:DEAD-box ATP-dependent RNA helicase ISE2-chloroplastic [Striga hermonthica]|uniref:DEAD-box ATP-dependent RNA helicase ISE2-chloroplastic n=1 Tax=Striga hermonthica TaxID=68872 RepID=A0A9N7RKM8_STRHE|nr:DEAD-box ATP-dependent RNA helicase ISE2-chloroplastic [Striga hermonthica]